MTGTCKLCGTKVTCALVGKSTQEAQQLYGLELMRHLALSHGKRLNWLHVKMTQLLGLAVVSQFTHDNEELDTSLANLAEGAREFFLECKLGELDAPQVQVPSLGVH